MKAGDWASAIDVLFHGAVSLLRAGHGGSGGDLGCYLLEVYGKGEMSISKDEKGRHHLGLAMDSHVMLRPRLYDRALTSIAEGIPSGRADKKTIHCSDDRLVLQLWGISQRGPGIAPFGWERFCRRYVVSGLGQQAFYPFLNEQPC